MGVQQKLEEEQGFRQKLELEMEQLAKTIQEERDRLMQDGTNRIEKLKAYHAQALAHKREHNFQLADEIMTLLPKIENMRQQLENLQEEKEERKKPLNSFIQLFQKELSMSKED